MLLGVRERRRDDWSPAATRCACTCRSARSGTSTPCAGCARTRASPARSRRRRRPHDRAGAAVIVRRTAWGALARRAAAGAWAAAEPALREATGGHHSQARLIGGLAAADGGSADGRGWAFIWRTGRCSGPRSRGSDSAAWRRECSRPRPKRRAVAVHRGARPPAPGRALGAWPAIARSPNAFAQEVLGHAVFGAVLGALVRRRSIA